MSGAKYHKLRGRDIASEPNLMSAGCGEFTYLISYRIGFGLCQFNRVDRAVFERVVLIDNSIDCAIGRFVNVFKKDITEKRSDIGSYAIAKLHDGCLAGSALRDVKLRFRAFRNEFLIPKFVWGDEFGGGDGNQLVTNSGNTDDSNQSAPSEQEYIDNNQKPSRDINGT